MFPHMVDDAIQQRIEDYSSQALGWKLSGAGGGGYLVLVSTTAVPDALRLTIRRNDL
jgi:galactokinase/mevalonate kinase-like predicted kinase